MSGPTYTVSTACSSANHAIGQAFRLVRDGEADLAMTGGSEAMFTIGMLKAWEAMRVIAPDTCRPFSKDRRGMILGEGGAMMVLEPMDAAKARGAKIFAEICGFGMTADAHHLTQPAVHGPARAMRGALREAGLAPEEVGYINAHGTGTPGNDPVESSAIREVFGAHADKIGVSSTKSMHGHALGAAGALEAIATILALYHGILPPTANFNERDPGVRSGLHSQSGARAARRSRAVEFLRVRRAERRRRFPRYPALVSTLFEVSFELERIASGPAKRDRSAILVGDSRCARTNCGGKEGSWELPRPNRAVRATSRASVRRPA